MDIAALFRKYNLADAPICSSCRSSMLNMLEPCAYYEEEDHYGNESGDDKEQGCSSIHKVRRGKYDDNFMKSMLEI